MNVHVLKKLGFYNIHLSSLIQRDDTFLKRLRKHRFSELNKFDDDYYGDKVATLAHYRQWVRKQQKKKAMIDIKSSKNGE